MINNKLPALAGPVRHVEVLYHTLYAVGRWDRQQGWRWPLFSIHCGVDL